MCEIPGASYNSIDEGIDITVPVLVTVLDLMARDAVVSLQCYFECEDCTELLQIFLCIKRNMGERICNIRSKVQQSPFFHPTFIKPLDTFRIKQFLVIFVSFT